MGAVEFEADWSTGGYPMEFYSGSTRITIDGSELDPGESETGCVERLLRKKVARGYMRSESTVRISNIRRVT